MTRRTDSIQPGSEGGRPEAVAEAALPVPEVLGPGSRDGEGGDQAVNCIDPDTSLVQCSAGSLCTVLTMETSSLLSTCLLLCRHTRPLAGTGTERAWQDSTADWTTTEIT